MWLWATVICPLLAKVTEGCVLPGLQTKHFPRAKRHCSANLKQELTQGARKIRAKGISNNS